MSESIVKNKSYQLAIDGVKFFQLLQNDRREFVLVRVAKGYTNCFSRRIYANSYTSNRSFKNHTKYNYYFKEEFNVNS